MPMVDSKGAAVHGGAASFLMVVTSHGIGYRRGDGVYSVPIGCLKP